MAAEGSRSTWFETLTMAGLGGLSASLAFSIAGMNIFLGVILVLALWDRFRPGTVGWRRTPLDEPLLVLACLTVLSALFALDRSRSLQQSRSLWLVLVFYTVVWYAGSGRAQRLIVSALIGAGSLVAVYALVQHYTGWNFDGDTLATTSFLSEEAVRYIARGTFSHHQTFANVYLMILCLAFSLALVPGSRSRRLVWSGAAALLALAVFVSFTRGVWLASAAALLFTAAVRGRRALMAAALVLVLLAGTLAVVPSTYSQRARSIFALSSNIDRLIIWEASWAMLRERPILGIGQGNYSRMQHDYLPPRVDTKISRSHAHNTYLQMALDRGLFALVAFGWIWYVVLRVAFTSLWRLRGREGLRLGLLRGATAAVIGFLVDGFFQNNFGDSEVLGILMLMVGLIFLLRVRQAEVEGLAARGGAHATA